MNQYVTVTGYPLITITESGKNDNTYTVTQQRYLRKHSDKYNDVKWTIPLIATVYKDDGSKYDVELPLFDENKPNENNEFVKETNGLCKEGGILKLNTHQSTLCRINYPIKWWNKLGQLCKNKRINSLERIGLVNDIFALCMSGDIEITTALDFVKYFKEEDDEGVWSEISSNLASLLKLYSDQKFYQKFQNYVYELYKPLYDKLGWIKKGNEDENDTILRSTVLTYII